MDKLRSIQKKWNAIDTDKERWEYVFANKNELGIMLDNDATYVVFHSTIIPDNIEDHDDLPDLAGFEYWIGNGPGIDDLMEVLGIEASA